jgi:predicted amidohydrolase
MKTVRIAAAQTAEFREDIDGALRCATEVAACAQAQGVALICFPEGFLQGYLTEESAARRQALALASPAFDSILMRLPRTGPMIVMGMIEMEAGHLFNTAVVVHRGALVGRYRKMRLLGGESCFEAGSDSPLFAVEDLRFGINICYDTNFPEAARNLADRGAALTVCPANNMCRRKTAEALKDTHNAVRAERCRESGLWLISSDVTGARDGRVSWGPTAVIDPAGKVVAQLPLEKPGLLIFDLPCWPQGG